MTSTLLIRPVGRPPKRPVILYDDFWYRAGSWDRARRVVAKVEWHRGELFPRVGFIVTNMTAGPEGVVRFYNGRGTAEQWIKEGKYALNWTRLSCHRFVANRVRLSLFILAYNLGNFLRRLCLPIEPEDSQYGKSWLIVLKWYNPTFPISDCGCPKNPPSFTTVMVGASTNAINYPIGLTKPSLRAVN